MTVLVTGPVTKDTTTVALGLAQIRIALASTYIGQIAPILTSSHSIGALASTKFAGNVDFFKLESGFPLMEDATFPLRESAMMEIAFKEQTPANWAVARGLDPTSYSSVHSGEINLGNMATPVFLRMEAVYTFPDGVNTMTIIFPRCQAVSSQEADFQAEDVVAVSISLEAKRADSDVTGGNAIWNSSPIGKIVWNDATQTTTTTTSSSSTTTTTTAP